MMTHKWFPSAGAEITGAQQVCQQGEHSYPDKKCLFDKPQPKLTVQQPLQPK